MSNKTNIIEINKPIIQRIVSNGRITIPNEIREIYNLQDGDLMEMLIIGFYKNNSNRNYQPNDSEEKKKMEISEGGEERTQTEGGRKHESLDSSGRSPQKTQSDTVRLSDKQDQPQPATTKRTPDQQRKTQKEKIRSIGGED